MKKTYNQTMIISEQKLPQKEILLFVYDVDKYEHYIANRKKVLYTGLVRWDVIEGGKEAEEIESIVGKDKIDEHHEYLVLHFSNGSTIIYRNSRVDMDIM